MSYTTQINHRDYTMNIDYSPIEIVINAASAVSAYYLGRYAHTRQANNAPKDPKKVEREEAQQAELRSQYVTQQVTLLLAFHPEILDKASREELIERGVALLQELLVKPLDAHARIDNVNGVLTLQAPHTRFYARFSLLAKTITNTSDLALLSVLLVSNSYSVENSFTKLINAADIASMEACVQVLRVIPTRDEDQYVALIGYDTKSHHTTPAFFTVSATVYLGEVEIEDLNLVGISMKKAFPNSGPYQRYLINAANRQIAGYLSQLTQSH